MSASVRRVVEVLEHTPRVLRALLEGMAPLWTERDYGPGTWSPKEVVAHLVFNERTDWIPRLRIILKHGASEAFEPFDREGHKDLLTRHSLPELLDLFDQQRKHSLAALREMNLQDADLLRQGRHPALGLVTLANLLAAWAVHDLNHISQVCKGMAFQIKPSVGAWEAYLSILAPPNPR